MTARAQQLAELALHWQEIATAAAAGSRWMGGEAVPIEHCLTANELARRALALAIKLAELARDAEERD